MLVVLFQKVYIKQGKAFYIALKKTSSVKIPDDDFYYKINSIMVRKYKKFDSDWYK